MRILLVNPRSSTGRARWLPLGLGYIAAVLLKEGFEVKVIDGDALGVDENYIAKEAIEIEPDIIGITAMTPQINRAWRIAQLCKDKLPKSKIILGGVHSTILPQESIAKDFIDIIVIGEGEHTMKELAVAFRENFSLDNIRGIVFKENGRVITTSPRELINNLDNLPYPARELFPFPEKYSPGYYRRLPYATVLTSRGCPGSCTFCNKSVFGSRFRARSAENVVDEISYLNLSYGIEEFHISDDNFSTDKKRALDICNLIIERKLNIVWACSNGIRIDFVNQELLDKMKKSGCYRVAFGIESGSPKILENINKKITLKKIEEVVEMAKRSRLITVGFFMVGNYGENEETIQESIDFMKKLDLDYAQFTIATPYPGTTLGGQVSEEGRIFANNWEDYDIYTGAIFEWNDLPKERIDEFQKRMYRQYYFRPMYIFKRMVNLRSAYDLHFLFDGLKMLKNVLHLSPPDR